MKLSEISGKTVFNDAGKKLGQIHDIVLDLNEGRVYRLTTEPINGTSRDEVARVFRENSILFKNIKALGNIVLVSTASAPEEPAAAGPEHKHHPYGGLAAKYARR